MKAPDAGVGLAGTLDDVNSGWCDILQGLQQISSIRNHSIRSLNAASIIFLEANADDETRIRNAAPEILPNHHLRDAVLTR
jgi:hypothetical protein